MEAFGPSESHQYEVTLWGWPCLGVARVSLYTPKDNEDRWSIWMLMVWRFSFGGSFPRSRPSRNRTEQRVDREELRGDLGGRDPIEQLDTD